MTRGRNVGDIELLLVDGDNLLHDVRGGRDEAGVAWLLPRLTRWRPDGLRIVVALDGHPEPGEAGRRAIAQGITFRHSGSRSADDLLVELLSGQPYAGRARSAVVTRDRLLADRARRAGGLVRSVDWLLRQIGGSAPSVPHGPAPAAPVGIGRGRTPRRAADDGAPLDEDGRQPWQPGRGATRKKGNPRRAGRSSQGARSSSRARR